MGFVKDTFDDLTGKTAARAAKRASRRQAEAQGEALDYLRERDELPSQIREEALLGLQDLYLGDGRADFLEDIRQDPFYQMQVEEAEEAALRGASASGLLRSGAVPETLAGIAPRLLQESYRERVGGLQGLSMLPTYEPQIAQLISGIGGTEAAGITGAAQARQAGTGNLIRGATALLGFSDPALKDNVKVVGEYKGLPWCEWEWNESAEKLGMSGYGCGVMADDVKEKYPHLIHEVDGHMMVDYGGLANG